MLTVYKVTFAGHRERAWVLPTKNSGISYLEIQGIPNSLFAENGTFEVQIRKDRVGKGYTNRKGR